MEKVSKCKDIGETLSKIVRWNFVFPEERLIAIKDCIDLMQVSQQVKNKAINKQRLRNYVDWGNTARVE